MGHTEIALQLVFGAATFLLGDHGDFAVTHNTQIAHDRRIVPKGAVAVKLPGVLQKRTNIIDRVRAIRVARKLKSWVFV